MTPNECIRLTTIAVAFERGDAAAEAFSAFAVAGSSNASLNRCHAMARDLLVDADRHDAVTRSRRVARAHEILRAVESALRA